MTDPDLERRVRELEWRLSRYNEAFEEAAEHNSDFQINATWGIVRSTSIFAFFGAYWLFAKLYRTYIDPSPHWVIDIATFFAAGTVWYWYTGYVERGYEGDKKKMLAWPRWHDRA